MTIPWTTAKQVAEIIRRRVPAEHVGPMVAELTRVPGDRSHRDFVAMLDRLLRSGNLTKE